MTSQHTITLPPYPRGFHLITDHIAKALQKADMPSQGVLYIHILHTSAGLTINENADPSVRVDYETIFNRLVPEDMTGLTHTIEGPDDMPAHIKTSLVGNSISVPITNGTLNLGTWQGIYLCEFRNQGGSRRLVLTVLS